MINSCKEYGLPEPLLEEFGDGFKITMYRKVSNAPEAVSEITSYTLGDASLTIHPSDDVAEIMEKGDEHDNDLSLVIQMV